jgi:zinc and cadmium transporter
MACSRVVLDLILVPAAAEGRAFDLAAAWGALGSVAVVSLLSLVGALALVVRPEKLRRLLPYLVSVAVGALLGSAFLHLIPEVAEKRDGFDAASGALVLGGILLFFVMERFIHGHAHGHSGHAAVAPVAWLNLAGDGLHNFADGILIAAAWMEGGALTGLAATVAVGLHEIPQELGDVAVLVHAGLQPRRAVLLNFASGLVSIIEGFTPIVLLVTAGGFVYIAAADLMPELHRERRPAAMVLQVACVLAGIGIMALARE